MPAPGFPWLPEEPSFTDLPVIAGWSLLPRMTLCVLDGPGEVGFVIAADPTRLDRMTEWFDRVGEAKGTWVVAVPTLELPGSVHGGDALAGLPSGQGGFVPSVG